MKASEAGGAVPPRVLVIDDEAGIREMLVYALRSRGFAVDVAEDGPQGVAMFKVGVYHAVVADHTLPGLSGWDVARAIRLLDPQVKIVIISGHREAADAARGSGTFGIGLMSKPFNLEDLFAAVGPPAALGREARP